MTGEEVAGEEGEDHVGLVPPAALVDDPDAVAVAVVGQPQVGARPTTWLAGRARSPRPRGRAGGWGRFRRTRRELPHLAAEPAEDVGSPGPGRAVARVRDDRSATVPGAPSRPPRRGTPRGGCARRASPRPDSKSPASIVVRSDWISSSVRGAAPGWTISTPLYSMGSWLPVMLAPPSSRQWAVAK